MLFILYSFYTTVYIKNLYDLYVYLTLTIIIIQEKQTTRMQNYTRKTNNGYAKLRKWD